MKTIKQYWLSSVANAALVAALGVDNSLFAQTKLDEPKPAQTREAKGRVTGQRCPPRLQQEAPGGRGRLQHVRLCVCQRLDQLPAVRGYGAADEHYASADN